MCKQGASLATPFMHGITRDIGSRASRRDEDSEQLKQVRKLPDPSMMATSLPGQWFYGRANLGPSPMSVGHPHCRRSSGGLQGEQFMAAWQVCPLLPRASEEGMDMLSWAGAIRGPTSPALASHASHGAHSMWHRGGSEATTIPHRGAWAWQGKAQLTLM